MAGLGALKAVMKAIEEAGELEKFRRRTPVSGPEVDDASRRKIEDIIYGMSEGQVPSTQDTAYVRDYLRNEGANPVWADMLPGEGLYGDSSLSSFVRRVPPPGPTETWYRGGKPSLKLKEPVFATRDPQGAGFYAIEGPGANYEGYGAIGEYLIPSSNPARMRDMYREMFEDPALLREAMKDPGYNIWDQLYNPVMRDAMLDRGYDSALGFDVLDRGDIETFIALRKELLHPQRRTIIGAPGNPIFDTPAGERAKPWPHDDELLQFEPRPWSRKAKGGLMEVSK